MRTRGKKIIFSRRDTWNMGDLLAYIISEGIQKFREKDDWFGGVPCTFLVDLFGTCDTTEEQMDYGAKIWDDLLKLIAETAVAEEPEYNGGFHEGPEHKVKTSPNTTRWDTKPTDPKEWERYKRESEYYELNKRLAMEEFGRYIYDIWW